MIEVTVEPAEQFEKPPDLDAVVARSRREASFERQRPRRLRETNARRSAVRFSQEVMRRGGSCRCAADAVGLRPRTLNHWRRRDARGELICRPRGRPCKESSSPERRCAVEWVRDVGPQVGLPSLRVAFPDLPRCELADLLGDCRREYRRDNRVAVERLTWTVPGRVWAMDHEHPPTRIDGTYDRMFAVRDLAGGMQLAWLPVPDETAESTVDALRALFVEHGPPLLLKSDNGSPFKSEKTAELLKEWEVIPLRSPPVTPRYNGSCEAGIGAMKIRTHYEAARHGRAGRWTCEDVEAARREANENYYSEQRPDFTAHQLWRVRSEISYNERMRFIETVERATREQELKRECEEEESSAALRAAEHRRAVRQALVELGLLLTEWRSITLPIKLRKSAKIS